MARRKNTQTDEPAASSFEESLARLEAIVEAMEHEQLPLEELVDSYEKGSSLLARCEAILRTARDRIELITLRNQPGTAPASEPDDDSPPATGLPDDSDQDDDIRLF
jgi:exodeoxyribonuclease VII small subunit